VTDRLWTMDSGHSDHSTQSDLPRSRQLTYDPCKQMQRRRTVGTIKFQGILFLSLHYLVGAACAQRKMGRKFCKGCMQNCYHQKRCLKMHNKQFGCRALPRSGMGERGKDRGGTGVRFDLRDRSHC